MCGQLHELRARCRRHWVVDRASLLTPEGMLNTVMLWHVLWFLQAYISHRHVRVAEPCMALLLG